MKCSRTSFHLIFIAARPSALVWSELRRQRELHEEKLKKRKQKFLEKRKKAGLDDVSEGGTYSVRSGRSGDIDEGFGVSMMSADITTATWGGSTQPSSTQNDSAVSADESDEENQGAEVTEKVMCINGRMDGVGLSIRMKNQYSDFLVNPRTDSDCKSLGVVTLPNATSCACIIA